MEEHYDFIGAADAVHDMIEMLRERQIEHIARPEHRNLPGAFGASRDDGKTWGLFRKQDDENDVEMHFVVQGAVSAVDLPPFKSLPRNRAHILQQSIQVTGLDEGSGLFAEGLRTIREAHLVLSRTVSGLGEWQPSECNQQRRFSALDIGNRIFEGKTSTEVEVPLDPSIDPNGVLSAMGRQSGLRHTVDNAVVYVKRRTVSNKFKYSNIAPQTIKVGDIVEVKFSIIAVPARRGNTGGPIPAGQMHRIKLKLRAVVLLDTEFSDNEARAIWESKNSNKRRLDDPEEDGRLAVVKRNGYVDDE